MKALPAILTIAGSDSGGGAGIQADIKTITCLDGFGMSVITALTAQNGLGVDGIFPVSPNFVQLQIQSIFNGFELDALKTGMLFSSEIIEEVANGIKVGLLKKSFPIVVDPVCVSQSGHALLQEDAISALKQHVIPLADLITPNKPEAERLTEKSITSEADIQKAGSLLLDMGAKAVLIKGGHFDTQKILMTDWLITKDACTPMQQPYVETQNNHGTGCTLSAAIATFLAHGLPLKIAVSKAQTYLNSALRQSFACGLGHGCPRHKIDI